MDKMTKEEEEKFVMLFDRNGMVLNFSIHEFNMVTTSSIGEVLYEKYGESEVKALKGYLNSTTNENRFKLLGDLFRYYENKMQYEYKKDYEDALYWGDEISRYDEKYANLYLQCKVIMDRLQGGTSVIIKVSDDLKDKFSSEYMTRQIDLMMSMQSTDPTSAIGLAKELIESCCKTILDELGIGWKKMIMFANL